MEVNPAFFRDLAYVFLAAVAGGLVAWRLRQPLIIGYVVAGILISPLTPGPSVQNVHTLELFAEIGVILLIFSVGLEFSVKDLLRAKWTALLGGPLGILLSMGLSLAVGRLVGWSMAQSLVVGSITCVASTMVLTRLLFDQGQLRTAAGRLMVAITLVEDLAVVVLVLVIPHLGHFEVSHVWTVGRELGRAALILVPAFFIAARVVPPFLKRVARTQSRELFFIVVLAVCLGAAALTQAIGLSLALGAFVAGLLISGSEYAHEALAQLFPVRDAFVALFFVTLGLLVDPRVIFSNLGLAAAMIALILLGKFAVWSVVVRLFGHTVWTAFSVATGLTQIGEFSFLLVQVARNAGIVGSDIYNATLAASLVTIFLNAALFRPVSAWLSRMRFARQIAMSPDKEQREEGLANHVVLCGFGRVGSAIGAALETFQVPYVVIEIDPDITTALRNRGIPSTFGDAAHANLLERAGVPRASLVIITLPDADSGRLAVSSARRMNANVPILARSHRRVHHEILARAGATEIIQPELEASATVIRHAFSYLKLPDEQVRTYLRGLRKAMDVLQEHPPAPSLPLPDVRVITLTNSTLIGRSISSIRLSEQFGVSIIAVTRASGEIVLDPPADLILSRGDTLRFLGRSEQIQALLDATSTTQ
jgi:CPA2 family monovalent cation:H+ antiporter-2